MKLCFHGKEYYDSALSHVQPHSGLYSPSIYNVIYPYKDSIYLFNTLTRRCALISDDEERLLNSKTITRSECANDLIDELIALRFLVPVGTPEQDYYSDLYSFISMMEFHDDSGYSMYDILPTTYCNARCFYCFEAGVTSQRMSYDTADRVVEFIKETRNKKRKIELSWFGGEPLCNVPLIDYICRKVRESNIPYFSTMITNGFIWTKELVDKAKSDWLLDKVQITLDGYDDVHNQRKNYYDQSVNAFQRTISNIHFLLDAGIGVTVRFNIDQKNIDSIWELFEFLIKEFRSDERIVFSPALLAQEWFEWKNDRTENEQKNIREQWTRLRKAATAAGFTRFAPLNQSLRKSHCMANSARSVTIQPDGKLYACQTGNQSMYYGNIFDGITEPDVLERWKSNTVIPPKCDQCKWLPECTPFDLCPASPSDCKIEAEVNFGLHFEKSLDNYFSGLKDVL